MPRHILIALIFTILFWSSAFAAIRVSLADYSPSHLALLRFLVASLALVIYALITRMRLPDKRDLPAIFLLGLIGISLYHFALNYGEKTVTAGAASLIIASAPIFSVLLARFFYKDKLTPAGWLGILLSFGGIAVITLGEVQTLSFEPHAFWVLLAALFTSIYIVFQRPLLKKYSGFEFSTYAIWAGTLLLMVGAPGLLKEISEAPVSSTLAVVYLGIFPTAISYLLYSYALSKARISQVISFLYLNPVFAIGIAFLWLGEIPAPISLLGGLLALVGVILVNRYGHYR
ncbi:MAG: membrane protein [Dehalococcoides mccartyi]